MLLARTKIISPWVGRRGEARRGVREEEAEEEAVGEEKRASERINRT